MKPYKIRLVQALNEGDREKRSEFCDFVLHKEAEEENFFQSWCLVTKPVSHQCSGKVNRHNVRIRGLEQPHEIMEHQRDSPKVNVFCAVSIEKVYGPYFFDENTFTGTTYLQMLQNWLLPRLRADSNDFILQQDGAPPHWNREVRRFLNHELPQRWIGRNGPADLALHQWLPRSPDLSVCDFFLWEI